MPQKLILSETQANLDIDQLHIDYALANVSVAYNNAAFVAEQVAPVIPTNHRSNKYFVYGKERFRRRADDHAPGSKPDEIGWSLSSQPYYCEGHALRGWYPWEASTNADPAIDMDIDTTETVTDSVLLAQEMNLRDTLVASLPLTDLSANSGQYQLDNANNDPIAYFDMQKETVAKAIGRQPNAILFGRPAWRGFRNNPNVLKHIYGTTVLAPDKLITPEMAAEKLEIPEVIIAEAMYDTSAEGEAPSLDYIWGDYVLLFYKSPSPGKRQVNLVATFLWNVGVQGRIVEKWYDQDAKRYVIDCMKFYDQNIQSSGAGVMYHHSVSQGTDTQ